MLRCEKDKTAFDRLSASYNLDRDIVLESNEGAKYVVINLDLSAVEPEKLYKDTTKSLSNNTPELISEGNTFIRNDEITNLGSDSDKNSYKSMQNYSKEKVMMKKHKEIQRKDIGASNNILDIAIVLLLLMIIRY